MTKKRHSITTIAEVLIDELDGMKKVAERIEKVSNTPFKVDFRDLEKLMEGRKEQEKAILSDLKTLKEKNKARVPNWVLIFLGFFFLVSMGSILYNFKKAESYDYEKSKANHWEAKYYELEAQIKGKKRGRK